MSWIIFSCWVKMRWEADLLLWVRFFFFFYFLTSLKFFLTIISMWAERRKAAVLESEHWWGDERKENCRLLLRRDYGVWRHGKVKSSHFLSVNKNSLWRHQTGKPADETLLMFIPCEKISRYFGFLIEFIMLLWCVFARLAKYFMTPWTAIHFLEVLVPNFH